MPAIEAVIFDWGGTLTAWHDIDFRAESLALAQAVVSAGSTDGGPAAHAAALHDAGATVWGWCRDEQRSATVADLFAVAGLDHDPELLTAYYEFWEPHTFTDAQVAPMWRELRAQGIRIGVLSNTIWPREWHEEFFRRDGVLDLVDGDVYTSEIPWTKPAPEAFRAAMEAVGVRDPARCVFVGDRPFDDIWGARNAGMYALHLPKSNIPVDQAGHSEGEPHAVIDELCELPQIVAGLCSA